MQQTASYPAPAQRFGFSEKIAACLASAKNKTRTEWIVDQLNIQPYQHILEIGYGAGSNLQQIAGQLKIGFIAGIDESIPMYRQAYRRNKSFIRQQLLQLHIGSIRELSYPSHYFHSIYSDSSELSDKNKAWEFWQLSSLLKSGGRMLQVAGPVRSSDDSQLEGIAEAIKKGFAEAGLINIQTEERFIHNTSCVAVMGFRA